MRFTAEDRRASRSDRGRRAPYLLLARQNRYAVVERRAGQLYAVTGQRRSAPMTDAGAEAVIGSDWWDEAQARRLFDEIVSRYAALAERMW
jgi:hypothetical protein